MTDISGGYSRTFMERFAFASLLGTIAGLWISPPVSQALLIVGCIAALVIAARFRSGPMVVLVSAYAWATLHGFAYQSRLPGDEIRDQDMLVSGCVADFPRVSEHSTAFLFKLTIPQQGLSLLYLRSFDPGLVLRAGACHDFVVRLKPPHGLSNPGQFDRQRWLMMQRVHATGYVKPGSYTRARPDLKSQNISLHMRRYVLERIRDATADTAEAALIEGLTVGVRSSVSREQWALFRETGTIHLMAISGLHVGLVAAGLWWSITAVSRWRMGPSAPVWPAALAAGGGALGYALLAGWSAPTSRAALMCLLLLAINGRRRVPRPMTVLSAVVVISLFTDPFVILSSGFWMSYLAVLLLVTLRVSSPAEGRAVAPRFLSALLRAQWRLSVGLAVPNMLLFDALVILGPLVNLIAIPLFSMLVLPLCLLSVACLLIAPALGEFAMACTTAVLQAFSGALHYAAGLAPLPTDWLIGNEAALALVVALSALLLMPLPLRSISMSVALGCSAGVVIAVVNTEAPSPLRVDVMDVGQGTAVLVRTPARTLLVDTGPAWPGGDAGQATVLPFLRVAGVTELDAVIVSHADADHAGGLASVINGMPVDTVFMSNPPSGSEHFRCERGMHWRWDEVDFHIVHPSGLAGWSENEASCMLLVNYRGSQIALPGDIEKSAESVIVARWDKLQSDLIVVPHHGSKTSSTEAFVGRIRPRYAVVTSAFWNRWHFPAVSVVEQWRSVGACTLNTAQTGALAFAWLPDSGLTLQRVYKRHWRRPWPIRPLPDDDCLEV